MHKIVLFYPDVLGGVRTYVTNLAAWFNENNVNCLLIAYSKGQGFSTVKKPGALPNAITLNFSPYATETSKYRDLVGELNEDDILICNDSFELEAISNQQLKNRTAFILHGDLTHYHNTLIKFEGVIDHVFCVSKGLKEKYGDLFPELPFSIAYTLLKNFKRTIRDNQSVLKLVFIGRFEKMKGSDDFVKVIETINARSSINVHWYVYTTKAGADKSLLTQLPSNTAVFFDTPYDQLMKELEDMDILVFPSRSEGLGLVVLEAMKRGVAPIARNLPIGIPDMVEHKKTGFLIHSSEEIISTIELLHNDRALLKKIKQNANEYANSYFDPQKWGNNFIQLTKGIVAKEKEFDFQKQQRLERVIPEALYRVCKFLFHLVKYRKLTS
jgi:glycosyltransferase involved in cell wall biosynthesis